MILSDMQIGLETSRFTGIKLIWTVSELIMCVSVNSISHASLQISDPTLYLFQILNIRNCVLYGDIVATNICTSSIERFGGFKIYSNKTKLPHSSGI